MYTILADAVSRKSAVKAPRQSKKFGGSLYPYEKKFIGRIHSYIYFLLRIFYTLILYFSAEFF